MSDFELSADSLINALRERLSQEVTNSTTLQAVVTQLQAELLAAQTQLDAAATNERIDT